MGPKAKCHEDDLVKTNTLVENISHRAVPFILKNSQTILRILLRLFYMRRPMLQQIHESFHCGEKRKQTNEKKQTTKTVQIFNVKCIQCKL
jgi:hypothetical protein